MKNRSLHTVVALAVLGSSLSAFADEVITNAMKKYHKPDDALCKKVSGGTANDAEVAEMLKIYEQMAGAKPKKGDDVSWKEKTTAVINAVKKIQSKDAAGTAEFKTATNCKACHTAHK
ncbi:MAG: hypothetical protein V4662_21950 [Verrucomicrobiota bacterium]